jgi:predicted phosphodiesterase
MHMPDTHVPYHDRRALACFEHAVDIIRPKLLIVYGDLMDAGMFSKHGRKTFDEARAYDFQRVELEPTQKLLDRLQKKADHMVMIEGNHEAWIEACAVRLGQSMEAVFPMISPKVNLASDRKNFTWVPYHGEFKKTHFKITPRLLAMHGVSVSKYAASKHLEKFPGYSVIYGHTHRAQSDKRRDPITDEVYEAFSPGCLARLQQHYMHSNPSDHVHGFGLSFVKNDKSKFTNYSITINQGECVLPDGKSVKG